MTDAGLESLASKRFWEEEYYWAQAQPPCRPDPDLPFDRTMARALADMAPVSAEQRVVEVGCAPAKWLAFYGERFGARVDGIEYSEKGARLSQRNLDACGLNGTVHHADFFTVALEPYDLVLSLGFIEHFRDLDAVFSRHLDLVKPGGRLVIGVPNFRGWNRLLQRWSDEAYLRLHNLEAMRPALYRALARRHGMELQEVRYVGGFDPIIIRLRSRAVTALAMIEARWRRLRIAERIDHPWFSPYLLTLFARPDV